MKTRIILSAIIIALISTYVFNANNEVSATPEVSGSPAKFICVTVTLTGTGSTSSSVWVKERTTGLITYIPHIGGGVYQQQYGIANGTYDVFACSSSSTHGAVYNQILQALAYPIDVTIPLQSGLCPYTE